jgi:UTP--glucose-1-phosphate uridylyltransferase
MQAFVSYGLRSNAQGRDFREAIQTILAKQQ